ncbi:hypothetical protein KFL_003510020 [Klebsormidium nitens]|uniref:Uncharacterized protein n=1 Tax=Klebsormidium nitens TaxID=105231 RepID=A0A1Y1IGY6_KLENI|nr:hypothetical protein KFL_003510020 [Klebsormidium nitens]|eukprot:GAQ87408.1 hypothetical protein KFL_003510020 [Klebsormidium nitens]
MIATDTTQPAETELAAAPAMDPELLRILESFDELKLPPLSAEVTRYLETGTHGLAQATGKLARLEGRESWGGDDGRGNLLDRIQGQLKRGSPWLKGSADRKKSKRDALAHAQLACDRHVSGNVSPDRWPSPGDSSSPPGSSPSSGTSTPLEARSPERSPSSDTPTSVLPYEQPPDLKSDPLSLDDEQTDRPETETGGEGANMDIGGLDTGQLATDDLALPTHLRCQTSPRPGPQSLPSSPFRSLTPTRSPLGLLSRASRSSPSSPDSCAADRNSAQLERNSDHFERSFSTEPPPMPHRRRNTSGSGLRRALFSVAHSLKSSLGHVARPHLLEHVAKPQPMDAAAVARHLLAPPRKLAPGVPRASPPNRRRAFSQPLQPSKRSPQSSFQERATLGRGGPFAWDSQPPAAKISQIESGSEDSGSEQMTMAAVLEEQRLERLRSERDKAENGNGTVEEDERSEMETDDGGYFAPTNWKAASNPIPVPTGGTRFDGKGIENEDEWMECIDKQVVSAPFWREEDGAVEVEKRVTESPVCVPVGALSVPISVLIAAPDDDCFPPSVGDSSEQRETGENEAVLGLAASSRFDQNAEMEAFQTESILPGGFVGGDEMGLEGSEQAPPCRDVRVDTAERSTVLAQECPTPVAVEVTSQSEFTHSPEHVSLPRVHFSRATSVARALIFDAPSPEVSQPGVERKWPVPTIDVTSPAGASSTGQHSLTRSTPPSPQSQTPEPTAPAPASRALETLFPSPASPGSLSRNLEALRLGGSAAACRARADVPSNPEEYEAQLKEALPSIYQNGHFIGRSRSNTRAHNHTKLGDVGQRDRGMSPGAQQHFKLKWTREKAGAPGEIDEERYQKALFGTALD